MLQGSDLLASLPTDVLRQLAERSRTCHFGAGEVIFAAGDPGDTLHVVRTGMVEIRPQADADVVLAALGPGQQFGELAVFDPAPRSATAVATAETTTLELGRSDLLDIFAADPQVAITVLGSLARATTEAKEQVTFVNRFLDQKVLERTAEVRETQLEIIRRLGRAAEFRDDDTGEHVYRMSHYAGALAAAIGFDEQRSALLQVSAPMHDIGKIGIPDRVLLKPGKLDDEEWEIMRSHSSIGAQMLAGSTSPVIQLAQRIALEHHERWDGGGYPNRLRGEDICLEARICTVADVFDALTSRRPYKEPWSFDDALAEIERCGGTMFDPELASAFVGLEAQLRAIITSRSPR